MKLSEALVLRKQLNQQIESLWQRFNANLHRAEDEPTTDDDPTVILTQIQDALNKLEAVTIAINETNNITHVEVENEFEGTIMRAIAHRDALNRQIKGLDAAIGSVSYRHRRTKEDIKMILMIPVATLRDQRDRLAAMYRRLDSALQAANWNTEV